MLAINDGGSLLRALTFPLNAQLATLLLTRQRQLGGDIQGIARFIVIQQSHRPSRVEEALGFSLFTNRADGSRWGEPDYTPGFEFMDDHRFAYEFSYEFTTDFTHVIFVENAPRVHPDSWPSVGSTPRNTLELTQRTFRHRAAHAASPGPPAGLFSCLQKREFLMRSYDNAEAIAAAPQATTDPQLRSLLADRVHDWRKRCLLDLTHLLIVEAGDTEADIVRAVGFSPLISTDGLRFGSMGFEPSFDWLENRGGWWQLIMTVGNDGFAFELFIGDAPGVPADLRTLCQTYAR